MFRELICTIPQQFSKDGAVEHKQFTDLINLTAGASLPKKAVTAQKWNERIKAWESLHA